jgi:acyl-[acyl-carrier-protein]-phospholipid O-acyltransferase/long-chain-fatty-acid--[acyl-carrier-protein] ligase
MLALEILAAVAGFVLGYIALAWLFVPLQWPVIWAAVHLTYRFRPHGRGNVPAAGPVLFVCNHVSYIDWLLITVACPRRVRFGIWGGFYANPVMRFLLSFGRWLTIPLETKPGRVHALKQGLDAVVAELDAGRCVVIFAEGALTRNGQIQPFGRGVEHVLRHAKPGVAVVPACVDNLWGSLWSWSMGRVFFKLPERPFRRFVAVMFGEALPQTATAPAMRAAVVETAARCAILQSDTLLPPARKFVRTACRFGYLFKTACTDLATGTPRSLTWGKFLAGAWGLSSWLKPRLGPEANVGVWLPTGLGSALANAALAFRGKTAVNLNYTAGDGPVQSAVQQAGVRTVITAKRFLHKVALKVPDGVVVIHLEDALGGIPGWSKFVKFLAVVVCPGWFVDRVLLGLGGTKLDDTLTILFSSGSTGEPKGVMLSHRNVAANVESFRRGIPFYETDRFLVTLPFFHSFGYTVSLWTTLVVGMETVYYPDPRAAKEVGELCKKYACTILVGTATFLRFYLRRCGPDDFKSLRLIVCGAEKLPVAVSDEFAAKFGVYAYEGYGLTETGPIVGFNLPPTTAGGVTNVAHAPGTAGRPIPGVCVATFDPETHARLPFGAEGLLGMLGANVMKGYLNSPEKTAAVLKDGWYISGDVGHIEDAGFVRITGRVSRFAKIAGEMVPLERLDEEMHDLLAAAGERKLAVAAAPDPKRGERIVVLHLPCVTDQLADVFAKLRLRGIPNLWIPDARDCHVVEAFPELSTGKLDLKRLGEIARTCAAGESVAS